MKWDNGTIPIDMLVINCSRVSLLKWTISYWIRESLGSIGRRSIFVFRSCLYPRCKRTIAKSQPVNDYKHFYLLIVFKIHTTSCSYRTPCIHLNFASMGSRQHDLDDEALGQYLQNAGTIPGLRLPVVSSKIGYGQSNPTYFIDDAAWVPEADRYAAKCRELISWL